MVSFDSTAYKAQLNVWGKDKDLVKNLKSIAEKLQRDPSSTAYANADLVSLYAVDPLWTASDLASHRSELAKVLRPIKKPIVKQGLEPVLEALGTSHFDNPSFWLNLDTLRQQEAAQARANFVKFLLADPLLAYKAISQKDLHESFKAQGVPSSEYQSYEKELKNNGVTIFDRKLADDAESFIVPGGVASSWKDARNRGAFTSIFDVLLLHISRNERQQLSFYSNLAYGTTAITTDTVQKADQRATTASDSNEVQIAHKILAALKNEVKSNSELQLIVFKIFEEYVQKKLQRNELGAAVANDLVDLGINPVDANILLSLLATTGSGQRINGLNRTEEHLQRGELGSAQQTFSSVDRNTVEPEAYARIEKLLNTQLEKKKQLLETYKTALGTKKLEAARQAITEAQRLDTEDESLRGKLEAIPPEPAGNLSVSISANSAILNWAKSASSDVSYTVVRRTGGASSSPADGEIIAKNIDALTAEDKNPVIATTVFYTVFAERTGQFSDATSTKAEVYPQPANFTVQATSATSIHASWTVVRETSSTTVEVFDSRGNSIHQATTSDSKLLLDSLITGEKYTVSLVANYVSPSGTVVSAAVQASSVPREKANPVTGVDHTTNNSEIQLEWSSLPPGFSTEVWILPLHDNGMDFGDIVTADQLTAAGGCRASLISQSDRGGTTYYTIKAHKGILRIYPLVLVESGYLVGDYVSSGVIEPAKNVTVEYFNDTIKLAWEWTGDTRQMELAWLDSQGYSQRELVTLASYRRNGGAVIQGRNISNLTIAATTKVDGETIVSAPASIPLKQDNKIEISYEQKIKSSGLFSKPSTTITARSLKGYQGNVPVHLCLSLNPYFPLDANGCLVLDRFDLDFSTSDVATYSFDIPKTAIPKGTKQFWLVLFPQEPASVKINQPHTSQLKG